MFVFLKGRCLSLFGFGESHVHHRHGFGFQCLAVIGSLDVGQQHLQRDAVANDMVDIEQEIEMPGIFQQSDMEQPVIQDVEGNDKRSGIGHGR